ncbi:MAG: CHAP domain-containing protein [Bacteroidota bacterium]
MDKLQIAILEIGKQEIPLNSNWGVHVQKYLHSVGIDFPASWCMAFVYWCTTQAKPVHPLVKTGGVLRQWNEIDPKYKFKTPAQGDIFIMDFGKGLGHTGFVESVEGDLINTIEGNATTISGSREGIEVCRKQRKISACKGFIRI